MQELNVYVPRVRTLMRLYLTHLASLPSHIFFYVSIPLRFPAVFLAFISTVALAKV